MEKNDMWNHDEIMKEENVETGTVYKNINKQEY